MPREPFCQIADKACEADQDRQSGAGQSAKEGRERGLHIQEAEPYSHNGHQRATAEKTASRRAQVASAETVRIDSVRKTCGPSERSVAVRIEPLTHFTERRNLVPASDCGRIPQPKHRVAPRTTARERARAYKRIILYPAAFGKR